MKRVLRKKKEKENEWRNKVRKGEGGRRGIQEEGKIHTVTSRTLMNVNL